MSAPTVLPESGSAFAEAFPSSTKVLVEGPRGVRVPMREIALSGGEPPLRVYDTSGPQGCDVAEGLPSVRGAWIAARAVAQVSDASPNGVRKGRIYPAPASSLVETPATLLRTPLRATGPVTQLQFARRGEITEEMEYIAVREGMTPEFVRSEVARGRAIIPANINHPEVEPMIIGRGFAVKINANIGNSAVK